MIAVDDLFILHLLSSLRGKSYEYSLIIASFIKGNDQGRILIGLRCHKAEKTLCKLLRSAINASVTCHRFPRRCLLVSSL